MNATINEAPIVLSIIIKALNEEALIGACLESALAETAHWRCEVILADSLSTDRTVEIARRYPVEIVRFARIGDRGCGAALQLGYQFARGRYVYVLDGDMALEPGFIGQAIAYLDAHPDVAGVGGLLRDTRLNTAADRARAAHYGAIRQEHQVASLGGGGLYRRTAIEAVAYLAHRWLPACEEAELGVRLKAAGWKLMRLPLPAVQHSGHQESSGQMLVRLWRNGRMQAYGMFLRSAIGKPWFTATVRSCWFVFAAPVLHLLATLLAGAVSVSLPAAHFARWWLVSELACWLAVGSILSLRKKSAGQALLSLFAWHLYALAAARGFVRAPGDPHVRIDAEQLTSPPAQQDQLTRGAPGG